MLWYKYNKIHGCLRQKIGKTRIVHFTVPERQPSFRLKPRRRLTRDRGATLRLGGGGGAPLVTQYWGGNVKIHFLLLNLYNFKNIGGHVPPLAPPPPTPRSLLTWWHSWRSESNYHKKESYFSTSLTVRRRGKPSPRFHVEA